jgi:hypothetical protein
VCEGVGVRPVIEAPDGRILDRAIHAFDLAVCPRMVNFVWWVLDVVLGSGEVECVDAEELPDVARSTDDSAFERTMPGARRLEILLDVCAPGVERAGFRRSNHLWFRGVPGSPRNGSTQPHGFNWGRRDQFTLFSAVVVA